MVAAGGVTLCISSGWIAAWLWSATIAVFGLGVFQHIYVGAYGTETVLHRLSFLSLDGEATVPAWYSSMLMWTAAGLAALHAAISRRLHRGTAIYWWSLTAFFVYLSVDEASQLHEYAPAVLPAGLDPGGIFTFRWVIVAGPLLAIGGLVFLPFLWRLPRTSAFRIMLAGTVFVSGAFGMELVGGYILSAAGEPNNAYYLTVFVEEGLEMAGLCLFIAALLDLLAKEAPTLTLSLDGRRRSSD